MDLFTLGLLQKNLSGNKSDTQLKSGESSYTITDAVNFPVLGLNLYGKSTQDGTPSPENPVEIVSVGDSGSVAVQTCGKNLFPWNDYTEAPFNIWGAGTGSSLNKLSSEIQVNIKSDTAGTGGGVFIWQSNCKDLISPYYGNTFTISYELRADSEITVRHGFEIEGIYVDSVVGTEWKRFSCSATIKKPCNIGWKTINQPETILYIRKIQIEIGDTATEYEPYKGSTSTITSALPLCGIPVSSGGNYTDSNGQQWICDELIYNVDGTGKIVKHTSKYTFTGNENFVLRGHNNAYVYSIYNLLIYKHYLGVRSVSDKYICSGTAFDSITAIKTLKIGENQFFYNEGFKTDNYVYFGSSCTTLEDFKAEIAGSTIIYPLAEPQEIPLTAAEMTALRELNTFNGTTNISNSDNAEMDVKYCINQVMADYYPIFAGQGADVQPLVLFQGTDEGYSLADGFTGFSVYYTDTLPTEEERITISKICADDQTTESRYGYLISKIKSINNSDYNYTDSAVISSNEMVDLTNYKTLCIDFYGLASYNTSSGDEKDNISNSAYFRIDRPDTLPQSHISYDWTGWDNMGMYYRNHNKYYFDVSQISGEHYLCFGIFHGNYSQYYLNGIKIYKMTLI